MQHHEDAEQKALIAWARLVLIQGPDIEGPRCIADYLIAYPNGGKRLYIEAARMNGLGVKKGVVDLLLPVSRLGFHGLWIEMKKPISMFRSPSAARDAVTDEQRIWMMRMRYAGYAAAPTYGWDEARLLIVAYLKAGAFHHCYHQLLTRFDAITQRGA